MTFEEAIVAVLQADAVLTSAGTLGNLCGYNASTKPTIIFHDYPAQQPARPYLTYSITGEAGYFPKTVFIDIKCWGGNIRAIHNRIHDLLHKKLSLASTDWLIKGIQYESSGPRLWDDSLKCCFQRQRFWAKVIKV